MIMPIGNRINGVWRDTWAPYANIDGVWRELDAWACVNGVWRQIYDHTIYESDILGFRMVYKIMDRARHPKHPELVMNNDLPVVVGLTGENASVMDTSMKGIVFEYFREEYEKEGMLVYKGDLYAILKNDQLVNVGLTRSTSVDDGRIPSNIPGVDEAWSTNKLANLTITMDGYVLYESNGYHMDGWNSLFSMKQFLDESSYPDKIPSKASHQLDSYIITPLEERDDDFDTSAYIGIARNMTSDTGNMIGSYGLLDHTISAIKVNGIPKPFVFEIYN